MKEYSITNAAGVKVQPYFTVPPPRDPNLYHFRVQGEQVDPAHVRIWLSSETARALRAQLGEMSPENIGRFVVTRAANRATVKGVTRAVFEPLAVDLLLPTEAYRMLRADGHSVSDEHAFRLLLGEQA